MVFTELLGVLPVTVKTEDVEVTLTGLKQALGYDKAQACSDLLAGNLP